MLAAKTLSLIPGTHMMEGENQFLQDVKKYLISSSCKFCNSPLQSHKSGKQLVRGTCLAQLSGIANGHPCCGHPRLYLSPVNSQGHPHRLESQVCHVCPIWVNKGLFYLPRKSHAQ